MQAATNNTELISFGAWTLRVRASQAANPRLLVLIHGWTGDENSMWIFARTVSPDYWVIAPRGPYTADPSGFSWRPNDPDTFGRPSAEKLKPAVDALVQLVDDYAAAVKINSAQFDIVGFSQGAAMVNMVGMYYPQRVHKMGVLAGFVPGGMEDVIRQRPLTGKQIFVTHGTQDQLIPIDRARASIALMEQAGAKIIYCEDDVAHKVSSNCLRALEDYLKD